MRHRTKNKRKRIQLSADAASLPCEERSVLSELPLLLYLLSGLVGLLLVVDSVRGVSFGPMVYVWPIALCMALWAANLRGAKLGALVLAASAGVVTLVAWQWRTVLPDQITFLVESVRGLRLPDAAEPDPWQAGIVLGCALSILLYGMECLLKAHIVLYVLTTAVLAISPFLAVRITAVSLLPLIVFQISFWALHSAGHRSGRRNIVLTRSKSAKRTGSWMATAGVVALFLILAPVLANFSTGLYDAANKVEGFASRTFRNVSETDPVTDGQLGLGNNYPTGNVKLELETTEQPAQAMYLRGFRGGDYVGGAWRHAYEDEIYTQMESILHWGRWSSSIPAMLNEMYYVMNEMMVPTETGAPTHIDEMTLTLASGPVPNILTLRHPDGDYDNSYVPYYSRPLGGWNYRRHGDRENGDGPTWRYGFRFYEQADMDIDWDNIPPEYTMVRDWYAQLQDAYMQVYGDTYTRVPRERLPQLCALVEENPLEDLDEITAFILYTLQNSAEYSLTPGWAPVNNDIVEYFLFERKSGYCVHFASAATLMYRLYGIPARYAAGYVVTPDEFVESEPGLWTANVTDEAAHAWVEIFLPELGWTPVEVTPAQDGAMTASYPGFEAPDFARIVQQEGWTPQILSAAATIEENAVDPTDATGGFFTVPGTVSKPGSADPTPAIWLCLIGLACLLPVILEYRRLSMLWRMKRMDARTLFDTLLDLAHYCGAVTDCDGTEADFATRLASEIPALSEEDARTLTSQVESAAYGPQNGQESEDTSLLLRTYWRAASSLSRGLGRARRWTAKYIRRLF